MSGFFPRSEI